MRETYVATGADRGRSHVEKERARAYRARTQFHDGQISRRRRDNLIAGAAGGALILALVAGQVAYFTAGPGTPAPSPSPTESNTPAPAATPEPDVTPSDEATPAPTP